MRPKILLARRGGRDMLGGESEELRNRTKGARYPNCGTGEWREPFTVHPDGGIV